MAFVSKILCSRVQNDIIDFNEYNKWEKRIMTIDFAFEPTRKNKNFIFISYAHKDAEKVAPYVYELHRRGYEVWYDRGINALESFKDVILRRIEDCACFVAFISNNYANSSNCISETSWATQKKIQRLPVFIEKMDALPSKIAYDISNVQYLNAYEYNSCSEVVDIIADRALKILTGKTDEWIDWNGSPERESKALQPNGESKETIQQAEGTDSPSVMKKSDISKKTKNIMSAMLRALGVIVLLILIAAVFSGIEELIMHLTNGSNVPGAGNGALSIMKNWDHKPEQDGLSIGDMVASVCELLCMTCSLALILLKPSGFSLILEITAFTLLAVPGLIYSLTIDADPYSLAIVNMAMLIIGIFIYMIFIWRYLKKAYNLRGIKVFMKGIFILVGAAALATVVETGVIYAAYVLR